MILQALAAYYASLAEQGKIARPGWTKAKIAWALEIDADGTLRAVLPLKRPSADGKKQIPRELILPAAVKRTAGIASNFLWDNSAYLLGVDDKGNPERAIKCFEDAKVLHQRLLMDCGTAEARAICAFFDKWTPDAESPLLADCWKGLCAGENLVFFFDGKFAPDYPALSKAWQRHYDTAEEGEMMPCLVTGETAVPASVHPSIKNVRGAQSSGAALVSFNADAFCSYNRTQSENAPVSKAAAFAYTAALNTLLADREHVKLIGDATTVYWAEEAAPQYQDAFSALLEGTDDAVTNADLDAFFTKLAAGEEADFGGLPVNPSNRFYILGLSPNAARISVRFFYRDSFGSLSAKLQRHYRDIFIISDGRNKWSTMPLWALLRETVNMKSNDKTPSPQMAGDVFRAMLSGGRYPETLMNQTLLRIRAEHEITRGRAGIVKAYLLRNTNSETIKEVATVSLNPDSTYTPYVLGRLFSVLEAAQQAANPGINATIKDRFFNSACATPAAVFPLLMKLSNSHLRKLDGGLNVYYAKQIGGLTERLDAAFPKNLSLQDQGAFILGYYHQTQKRYEKKQTEEEN